MRSRGQLSEREGAIMRIDILDHTTMSASGNLGGGWASTLALAPAAQAMLLTFGASGTLVALASMALAACVRSVEPAHRRTALAIVFLVVGLLLSTAAGAPPGRN